MTTMKEPAMKNTGKFYYRCVDCGTIYGSDEIIYLCHGCKSVNKAIEPPKGVLKVLYFYDSLRNRLNPAALAQRGFLDILPLASFDRMPNLRIGNTPLYRVKHECEPLKRAHLFLKDDSQNPTFSFKDRASALVSAFARERGLTTLVAASTGNAGSSLAGICAAQQQKAIIMLPEKAPLAKITQVLMYGATIVPVKGTYDDAFDLSVAATEHFGWYNRNTAFNPLTIEGKKTVAIELFQQLGFKPPDLVFVPTGDGVILAGVYKGFEDLHQLGLIERIPTIVAVQARGSDNLVRNIDAPKFISLPSHTIADSIAVEYPRNFFMARQFIMQYEGKWLTVSDDEILTASRLLATRFGMFTEPASAAAYAGMVKYTASNPPAEKQSVVVLLTGSGLKDLGAVTPSLRMPEAISPDITELKRYLKNKPFPSTSL